MNDTPDSNDLVYNTYSIDIVGFLQFIYEDVLRGDWGGLIDVLEGWWNIYSIIAVALSFLFFVGYIYAKIRHGQINTMEQEALLAAEEAWRAHRAEPGSHNTRWEVIQKRVSEDSPESWRIAILEADILLDETLSNAGYVGQTLGEKLKGANPQSFTTIQDAWEAHKVRNSIAHVGSDFVLTKKIAQETITRFERVFREFGVI